MPWTRRYSVAASLVALFLGSVSTPVRAQSPEDGFNPGANDRVTAVAVQPDGKILVAGSFTTLGGGGTGTTPRSRIGRLNADGSLDETFNPGANDSVTAVAVQPDGKILVVGGFTLLGGGGTGTTPRGRIGRLNADGSLDATFDPGANDTVTAVAVQPDGKVLVAGSFTTLGGGGTGFTLRNRIGRLNPDGSLDTTFNPGADDVVGALAVQPDGKILVGGFFTMMGGGTGTTPRGRIGRLNANGSLDATFNPGANGVIAAFAVQTDGKILVGGGFTTLGGGGTGTTARNYIGRLNHDGSLDATFNPGANATVHALAVQPDGQILVSGIFTTLGGGGTGTTTRNRIGRLTPSGALDTTFNPGANNVVATLTMRPDGRILVGGFFTMLGGGDGTTSRKNLGQLNADGSLDVDFDTAANYGTPCCTGGQAIYAMAVQSDGKILLGGAFTELGNAAGSVARRRLGRLNPDGTVDNSFTPLANGDVTAIAVQPDGKILVGGAFTALGNETTGLISRGRIGRLNADGTVDLTFDPGANSDVHALVIQPNGQILVGGSFDLLGGGGSGTTTRYRIGRLNADGSIDAAFNPGTNGPVRAIALQPDGRVVVGGNFTMMGGGTGTTTRNYIGRLESNGSLDGSFDPGASARVLALVVQPDGQVLVGGSFDLLGGGGGGTTARSGIGRLFADGSLDTAFNPGANSTVNTFAVQTDGQILVGGNFTLLGGGGTGTTVRNFIGRLSVAGVVDPSFDPNANDRVNSLGLQADGRILVGGQFTAFGPTQSPSRYRIARLSNAPATVQTLDVTCLSCQKPASGTSSFNVTVSWMRSGAGTEVDQVTFDFSGDGVSYLPAGAGTRVATQWRFTGLTGALGQSFFVRARGYYGTGFANGSGSILESIRRVNISCPTIGAAALTVGTVGAAYSTTFTATDALGLVSFSTLSALPAGLTMSGAGVLAGTPAQDGTFPLTVAATDLSSGCTGSRAFTLTVLTPSPVPTISGLSPASATSGGQGFTLTVNGTGFINGSEVRWNGTARPTTFGSSTQLQAVISAADIANAGTASVAVFTPAPGGGTSAPFLFPTTTPPTIALDKTALRFAAVANGATFASQTAAQVVRLTQTGTGTVTWTATSNQPWLQVSPASGSGSANLSISVVSVGGLPVGSTVTGAITLTLTNASNTAGPITVSLSLIQNGTSANPFGLVETPLDNTTGVTGAIPVTGWALDDVEVTRVMICRAPIGAEVAPVDPNCGGAAQIFVGLAVFIDGARPDVAAGYPGLPLNTRAGWGLMVLTNMLPAHGNGTYHFSMWAQDRDGHTTLLGTRSLTCANASATRPFGAIDTPTQGGTAAGTSFVNFGWALTPLPKTIPVDGSTITVQVDGVTLGTAAYNNFRSDIATLFPGLNNTNGAVGFRTIDTTTLSNGLHTIHWIVTDNQGAAEGIGSRFFTVSNGAGGALTAAQPFTAARPVNDAAALAALPLDTAALLGRRGWDASAPLGTFAPSATGRTLVRSEEVNRVELQLGSEWDAGYLRTREGLAPLPIGSHLDTTTGVFTWAPGVGFVGAYDLVFVQHRDAQAVARREVRILLAPKGSGRVGPQVVIDTPTSQQGVDQPFILAGWAADLKAAEDTGIATLHVWAYPLAGGPPVFLGATAYGGVRPDVAAVHGDQFEASGFGLQVQGLTPGDYDLAVFAWSTELADFAPARIVRVTVRP